MIILVGDTDITYSDVLVKEANNKKIRLFVLNVNPKVTLSIVITTIPNKTDYAYYSCQNPNYFMNQLAIAMANEFFVLNFYFCHILGN